VARAGDVQQERDEAILIERIAGRSLRAIAADHDYAQPGDSRHRSSASLDMVGRAR
jgi:hypothetical protein